MVLIDTHTHLNFPEFHQDMETVIERAFTQGVVMLVNVGTDLTTSQESVNLAHRYREIYTTVGVHPHYADNFSSVAEQIRNLARSQKVVAIGEIGLDYFRSISSHDNQLVAFRAQLNLAVQVEKPVVLHCRDAYTEVLSVLEQEYLPRLNGRLPGVIHSFAAGPTYVQKFLKLGFYIGLNNLITYPKNDSLQEAVKIIPLERIIIETDCPYLPPWQLKGQQSEPVHVAEVAKQIAELKGLPIKQVEDTTTMNARYIFHLPVDA